MACGGCARSVASVSISVMPPAMPRYEEACAAFSWTQARAELAGLPGGGMNICHETLDRHADGALAGATALRCIDRRGRTRDISYLSSIDHHLQEPAEL